MQAWGTSSRFETRETDYYPSKSAVIGIIAASFGYKRYEDDKTQELNKLDFAVRIDQEGVLARDFHTAIKYKTNGTIDRNYVTNRYYIEDAVFVVAISHNDDQWMDEIYYALTHPYFQPFMGRRSCPIPVDFVVDLTDQGPIEALKNLDWQASVWYKKKHKNYRAYIYADKDLLPQAAASIRNDRVISFSQKDRKLGPRFEARTDQVLSQDNEEQLDFYESI